MQSEATAIAKHSDAAAPAHDTSWPATKPIICGGPLPTEISRSSPMAMAGKIGDNRPDDTADQSITGPVVRHGVENGALNRCPDGWLTRSDLYVTFRKLIEADHDKNLKSVPRKQRAMVRKGMQNGLHSIVHQDARQLHGIYAESVRNLGTPVFSRRYFALLTETFGADCDIVTVLDDDNPIAAVMNFYFRDEVLPYYGGGTAFARQRAGNDFMYWEVMRRAADRGCRLFDFGRSKLGTGAFDFKKNWGFEPRHLCYRYKLAPGASIPDHNPLNPKYRYFIAGWKRLPLPIANAIGPSIVRGLG
jgi:FemAB-related protein (PEP-CTERM system-associated)